MTKRRSGKFKRNPQDNYETPPNAVMPLLELIDRRARFIEPCAGAGKLTRCLIAHGLTCVGEYDLPVDARTRCYDVTGADFFVTNPPWRRDVLHAIIENLSNQLPAWLLLDWDWLSTKQSAPFVPRLRAFTPIGRVKWIPDSPSVGMDNACWCLFGAPRTALPAFYGFS
jgi:hypothetical protein